MGERFAATSVEVFGFTPDFLTKPGTYSFIPSGTSQKITHGVAWRVRSVQRSIEKELEKVSLLKPLVQNARKEKNLSERDVLYSEILPGIYREEVKKKPEIKEKKVLFVEDRYLELSDNFRLIYQDLLAIGGYEIHIHFLSQFDVSKLRYNQNQADLARDAADAKVIFLNDASPIIGCLPLRPETQAVQLWHACGAFKKFGKSTEDSIFGADAKERRNHPVRNYANLSLVTVSSTEVEWAYAEAMELQNTPEVVKGVGVSRTDIFYDPEFIAKSRARMEEAFPASAGKKIILYAPTFRGRVKTASTPGYFNVFDMRMLKEALGDDYVIVTKVHPYIKSGKKQFIPSALQNVFAYDATNRFTIDELLPVADVCISDYSSLIFEYSLFERPMLFYAYDLDDYNDWRGFYYDYHDLTPGPVCRDMDALRDELVHLDERFDAGRVRAFKQKFMGGCDGHATERIERMVFGEDWRKASKDS